MQYMKKIGIEEYNVWKSIHEEECTSNHKDSFGKMEVDVVKETFLRSMDVFGVKYKTYVEDGDSQTFKAITFLMLYDARQKLFN